MILPDYVRSVRESADRELARERTENAKLRARLMAAHEQIGELKAQLEWARKR